MAIRISSSKKSKKKSRFAAKSTGNVYVNLITRVVVGHWSLVIAITTHLKEK